MIFHNHEAIYFHIGKTAGVSIEKAFDNAPRDPRVADYNVFFGADRKGQVNLQHATPGFMQSNISPTIFNEYFKFTVVRNPFARLVSVYHYLIDQHTEEYGCFGNFVKCLAGLIKKPVIRNGSHYLGQYDYCYIEGQPVCDVVIHFEFLPSSFEIVRQKTGLISRLEHHNRNTWSPWKDRPIHDYFSDESADIVRTLYKLDFEKFGYSYSPEIIEPDLKSGDRNFFQEN
jgi:hypothetical protein